ncbi:phosphatidylinositol 4-kinase-like protein PIK1 [Tothia fuscella]|uniref:1-phosphatidylinositol 4-kinase n=1 Tax=Tothia fuscella TaxID=1048955 RepID=A0A9P4NY85_9PEZI|nr:phosphatidylinositol 4-kinase-like protein PIK1 [Tothia fuscella]
MSWKLLERFLESEHFNQDPSLCIQYLSRYADHVGIHYVLCSKLRQFSYEELEFFLPQLCHLLVSVDNESMALEEFILDLCEESVNSALLTFWLFQTYLHDLSSNPQSVHFKTTRRIYNKVQRIVFGASEGLHREKIKENALPVTVLASLILGAVAVPLLSRWAGPLAIAQARRPRPVEDVISDAGQAQTIKRSQTVAERPSKPRRRREPQQGHSDTEAKQRPRQTSATHKTEERTRRDPTSSRPGSSRSAAPQRSMASVLQQDGARLSTSSLPEIRVPQNTDLPTPPLSAGIVSRSAEKPHRRHTQSSRTLTPAALSRDQKIRLLRSNYFRSETAFLTALEDISNRLVIVPKPARLSALRAELALIAQDLPAEVDIPVISPATLDNGEPGKSRHHRIVRINPAEATSLNSAERVPYLLMVEVLKEDFDFDPDSDENQHLLAKLLLDKGTNRRRIFDISDANREPNREATTIEGGEDSVLEPANGDLGNSPMVNSFPFSAQEDNLPLRPRSPLIPNGTAMKSQLARSSSGTNARSSLTTISTPRTSNTELSRSNSPAPRRVTIAGKPADQPDVSALATHMRTAAQMLAQLEQSGSKRPKAEVAAIKAKIIASMQSLEEQSFFFEDENAPTFDTIMATADAVAASTDADQFVETLEKEVEKGLNSAAGAARMENDQKTGGVSRGDRDDPSAATFGEEWLVKKDRIRRSSPYGWMKNWDLVSVIVKTGADLRQEAFACQLIKVCDKIWETANVPVWVKQMRILVTGESSGLIETITNGVSLHSLKRSLTLANIAAAGTNPRSKRLATLRDHFIKTFGEVDSRGYAEGIDAFAKSLAAYSIISYILQLKDRHNGNILIDTYGHVIHIDFGFMLSNSPGSMGFEAAPFKLTQEYIDVLGGIGSPAFDIFKSLCKQAFQALRKQAEKLVMLVDVMGKGSSMPAFASGVATVTNSLRARFVLHLSSEEAEAYVEELIGKAAGSYYTRLYDTFQYRTQGIY